MLFTLTARKAQPFYLPHFALIFLYGQKHYQTTNNIARCNLASNF